MRIVGLIDGVEVAFDFTPPNTFTAVVPKHLDGIYIVELHVIDDAQNRANYANIFVKIDFKKMKMRVLPESFQHMLQNQEAYTTRELHKWEELVIT